MREGRGAVGEGRGWGRRGLIEGPRMRVRKGFLHESLRGVEFRPEGLA